MWICVYSARHQSNTNIIASPYRLGSVNEYAPNWYSIYSLFALCKMCASFAQGEVSVHVKKHKFALLSSLSSEVLNRRHHSVHLKERIIPIPKSAQPNEGLEGCSSDTKKGNNVDEGCRNVATKSSPTHTDSRSSSCSSVSSLLSSESSCSSDSKNKHSREAIHWRNLAVKFISLYQLNRRTEAEEIQR